MAHSELIADLTELAAAAKAAPSLHRADHELRSTYEQLRARAADLNAQHGFATAQDLATQLPTAEDLALIEQLDAAVGGDAPRAEGASSDRLIDAIGQLYGWATGLRLAYETLDSIARD